MKWFDVKIISVQIMSPKIQAIALFLSAKLRPKTESDQNKIVTIAFALSCQPFWHPYMYTFVKVNFWPNQWFQMIRDLRKSAIAYIFGLVGRTEIILTSNQFIYQAPTYFSVFSQLCSACSVLGFWAVFGHCRLNEAFTFLFYCLILFVCPWYIILSWKKGIFSLQAYQKCMKCQKSMKNQKM